MHKSMSKPKCSLPPMQLFFGFVTCFLPVVGGGGLEGRKRLPDEPLGCLHWRLKSSAISFWQ